jgi:hypothetical protein
VRAVSVALPVALICWYFGADVWHSLLIGGAVTTLLLSLAIALDAPNFGATDWRGGRGANRRGSRGDVKELSWSLRGSYGQVGGTAVRRARQVARRRLAARGLDLLNPDDRPEIERLIGRRPYVVLVRGDRRPPLLRSFVRCLDALDALERPSETP